MMDTMALLSTLRARDVKVWVEEDRLRFSAPAGAIDADMRMTLTQRKEEILSFLTRADALKNAPASIVPIKPEGHRPPVFALSGHGGDVYALLPLARAFDAGQPVLGVQPPGLDGSEPLESVEALARYELEQIRKVQPKGPYHLIGHCAGGTLAFEAAQQLVAAGEKVALLALIGSPFPTMFRKMPQTCVYLVNHARALMAGTWEERTQYVRSKLQQRFEEKEPPPEGSAQLLAHRSRVERATVIAASNYQPKRYPGEIHLFITAEPWHRTYSWRALGRTAREHVIPGMGVDERLQGPNVAVLANELQRVLNEIASGDNKASKLAS